MQLTYLLPFALTAVVNANIVKDPVAGMPPTAGSAAPAMGGMPAAAAPMASGMANMPGMPAAAAASPSSSAMAGMTSTKTLAQVIKENESQLSTLNTMLGTQPALLKMLETMSDITILAPSNAAFSKFEADAGNKAEAAMPMMLAGILEYHVLMGMHMSADIPSKMVFLPSMLGGSMNMTTSKGASVMAGMEGMSMVMKEKKKRMDMAAMAGMSGMAPSAQMAPPAQSAATNSTMGNMTMALSNVQGGQVVGVVKSGNKVELMSGLKEIATVQTADIMFMGGVIHVIDNVMMMPKMVSESALDSGLTAMVGALKNTNLVMTVDMMKDVTVFAPSNAAFKAIGGTASMLSMQQLSSVLEYHVVKGTVGYSTLLTMGLANKTMTTLQGATLKVMVENNKVFVNSAQVETEDIVVNNGVMHVINAVMNPMNSTAMPMPSATAAPIAFENAAAASNVPFTSGVIATTTAPSASTRTSNAGYALENPIKGAVGAAALFGLVAAL